MIFRHRRLWRSGVSDNRGKITFSTTSILDIHAWVTTNYVELGEGVYTPGTRVACLTPGIRFVVDLTSNLFFLKQHARAVSGSKVPPRPNVLKGLPARIHWFLWNLRCILGYKKFYICVIRLLGILVYISLVSQLWTFWYSWLLFVLRYVYSPSVLLVSLRYFLTHFLRLI